MVSFGMAWIVRGRFRAGCADLPVAPLQNSSYTVRSSTRPAICSVTVQRDRGCRHIHRLRGFGEAGGLGANSVHARRHTSERERAIGRGTGMYAWAVLGT